MIDDNKIAYQVLKRCLDLFPEWEDEGSRFWNRRTGEMITKDGVVMNDLVYRGVVKEVKDWADNHEEQWYLFPKDVKTIPYVYDGKELTFVFGSKY